MLEATISVPAAIAVALQVAGKSVPPPVTGGALIDTGCTHTAVSESVLIKQLMLHPTGVIPTYGNTGLTNASTFFCNLRIRDVLHQDMKTSSANLPKGLVALIGRDVLRGRLLVYDGLHGRFELHWPDAVATPGAPAVAPNPPPPGPPGNP